MKCFGVKSRKSCGRCRALWIEQITTAITGAASDPRQADCRLIGLRLIALFCLSLCAVSTILEKLSELSDLSLTNQTIERIVLSVERNREPRNRTMTITLSVESSSRKESDAYLGEFMSIPATMRIVVNDIGNYAAGITAHYHRNDGFYCRFRFHDLCDLLNRGCIMPDLGMAFNRMEVDAEIRSRGVLA